VDDVPVGVLYLFFAGDDPDLLLDGVFLDALLLDALLLGGLLLGGLILGGDSVSPFGILSSRLCLLFFGIGASSSIMLSVRKLGTKFSEQIGNWKGGLVGFWT